MPREILSTPSAPAPVAAYSVAVEAQGLVFLCGQVGSDAVTDLPVSEDAGEQTQRIMEIFGVILGDLGLSFADVVKTTIFVGDLSDATAVNRAYAPHFSQSFPVRSLVQASAGSFKVEIEMIAAR